jgi:hypothetical protein
MVFGGKDSELKGGGGFLIVRLSFVVGLGSVDFKCDTMTRNGK